MNFDTPPVERKDANNDEPTNDELTMDDINKINEQLKSLEEADVRFTSILNSVGEALTRIKIYDIAENVLEKAVELNHTIVEQSQDENVRKVAIFQESKSLYNLGLAYQEQEKKDEAFEAFEKAVSGFEEVNAEIDQAATFHRMAMTVPIGWRGGGSEKVLEYLIKSAELYCLNQEKDPSGWKQAWTDILDKMQKEYAENEWARKSTKIFEEIERKIKPILKARQKEEQEREQERQ